MKTEIIDSVKVSYDEGINYDQVIDIALEGISDWEKSGKELSRIDMTLDGEEITAMYIEKSPIKRVRRITGYLSNMENFNDSKRDELNARYKHC